MEEEAHHMVNIMSSMSSPASDLGMMRTRCMLWYRFNLNEVRIKTNKQKNPPPSSSLSMAQFSTMKNTVYYSYCGEEG